jgi:hypothetical protein
MDAKDLELYQEEQLEILKQTLNEIGTLKKALEKEVIVNVAPSDNIKGRVEVVNPVDTVTVKNFEALTKGLDNLAVQITNSIKNNAHKPLDTIKISNPVNEIKVTNLNELKKQLEALEKAVRESESIVNVEKQDIKLPKTPKDYLSVRLTDGKSFYNAVANLSTSLGSLPDVVSGVTGQKVLAVANADGSAIAGGSGTTATDFLYDKGATYTYLGWTTTLGSSGTDDVWRIKRMVNATKEIRYADGISSFTLIWDNRASYGY